MKESNKLTKDVKKWAKRNEKDIRDVFDVVLFGGGMVAITIGGTAAFIGGLRNNVDLVVVGAVISFIGGMDIRALFCKWKEA